MLKIVCSNRMEKLAGALIDRLKMQTEDPFVSQKVIVQSRGMESWLSMRIADEIGIVANIDFPFPKAFIMSVVKQLKPWDTDVFSPEVMTWRIYEKLGKLQDGVFDVLLDYTGHDPFKKYQLAERLARLFDNYMQFRPNMVLKWMDRPIVFNDQVPAENEAYQWQRNLWLSLADGFEQDVPTIRLAEFMGADLDTLGNNLTSEVHVFGISAMSPLYMTLLQKISETVDVWLYHMNPSKEFWEDTVKEKVKLRELLKDSEAGGLMDTGNPLLSSLGVISRDFARIINGLEPADTVDAFEDPGTDTLLHTIQHQILKLEDQDSIDLQSDPSIKIHVCHSPMREVEVLYDQLLSVFNTHKDIQPNDILVMTPDIQKYAPYIHAVFGTPEDESLRIPFSIADRVPEQENPVARTLLALLNLPQSRYTAEDVIGIFETPVVYRNFGFQESDLDMVRSWINDAAVRWGLDAEGHKKAVIKFEQNSWKFGRRRLLLGYAMHRNEPWKGIAAVPVETGEAELLGGFMQFLWRVERLDRESKRPRPPQEWREFVNGLLLGDEAFFSRAPEYKDLVMSVVLDIDKVFYAMEKADVQDLPVEVMVSALKEALSENVSGHGFLMKGVTFCTFRPMRSIPAKVICMIGMDDGAFPRQEKRMSFDLMTKPLSGDRNLRNNDKNLFLEALLSAREILYISYVGRSIKDNAPLPPSVLVSEIIDYLGQAGKDLIRVHPLQPFSPVYFMPGTDLVSYSRENLEGARAVLKQEAVEHRDLNPCDKDCGDLLIQPDELLRFLKHPVKTYLKHCANLNMEIDKEWTPDNEEPLKCDLDFFMENEILERLLAGEDSGQVIDWIKALGVMPVGDAGLQECRTYLKDVEIFAEQVRDHGWNLTASRSRTVDVKLSNGFRLKGRIDALITGSGSLLKYRYSTNMGAVLLDAWVTGLLLKASGDNRVLNAVCVLKKENRSLALPDSTQALKSLEDLTDLYCEGLGRPQPFFVRSSFEYAGKQKIKSAIEKWKGWNFPGECSDPWNSVFFDKAYLDDEPEDFKDLANRIFQPILSRMGKIKEACQ